MPRIAYGRNKTQVDLSVYPDNASYPIGTGEWNQDPEDAGILGFTKQSVTLSNNTFAPIATLVELTGETATDDIDSIGVTNTNEYDLLYILSASGQTLTLKHTNNSGGAGEIVLLGTVDKAVSTTVPTILIRDDSSGVAKWYEWGGGITNTLSDVGNVTVTNNTSGEVLKWNGSAWINNTLTEAGIAPTASPTFTGTAIFNDLTVNGTNTIINSTTLTVDDKNIEIASVTTPTNTTADGGGITIKGATDKTITWTNATGDFDVSEHFDIAVGKKFKIGGNDVFSPIDLDRVSSTPADPSANKCLIYVKAVDSNNDGIFIKIKKATGYQEVQLG